MFSYEKSQRLWAQGYGLTETCAASFLATGHPDFLATVGPPLAVTEFRLVATPELGYTPSSNPPRGEVCIRGPAVFAGYLDAEDLTREAFGTIYCIVGLCSSCNTVRADADGFFLTGDVGEITPHGGLRIIDRKKNMFKLAQGTCAWGVDHYTHRSINDTCLTRRVCGSRAPGDCVCQGRCGGTDLGVRQQL